MRVHDNQAVTLFRTCHGCRHTFSIDADEQRALYAMAEERGWTKIHLPNHCPGCRDQREQDRATVATSQNVFIVCAVCGSTFEFGTRDQVFYQARGFVPPKRCRPCRSGAGSGAAT